MPVFAIAARKGRKKKLIAGKSRTARTSLQRFKGLMLERKENFDYCLVFEMPSESRIGSSIHMLFMDFPIDAVFLDSKKRIADIAHSLRPWSLNFTPKNPAKYIIELKAGTARKAGLKIGQQLIF